MQRVVGINFIKNGRVYNFNAGDYELTKESEVIVETEKGLQYGFVVTSVKTLDNASALADLKSVLRLATFDDRKTYEKNCVDANKALERAKKEVESLGLNMRLIDANYTFDRHQLLFNFLADERIDFRELARNLAKIYRTRIELRQIGIRDKAKEIGGLGPCGRLLCCNTFLTDLNSVTINMAKNQLLALNPTKINGLCGRLLCCLSYEDDNYTDLKKDLPAIGSEYSKDGITGKVVGINLFKRIIQIKDANDNIVEVIENNGSR